MTRPAVARKRFGQHFLHDPQVIARIISAIDPRTGEALVEIGPGRGALTVPLLERCGALTAIEIDRDLARNLAERFGSALKLIVADVLDVDFSALRAAGPPLRVVGNLPYNISTPLLFHLLTQRTAIRDMHFMLQREVVERMVAAPGSKIYGRLTVMLAPWVRIESVLDVGPGAFRPAPKVASTVVRITPLHEAAFPIGAPERFEQVVRAAFSQRRKTLRNALKGVVDADRLRQLGIDPALRPERLAPEQFALIARSSAG
ncbi:MAG TPA: 16S rRNA (adenine(1518)-N(6)/adenine(1519)-N(6))-dimethyltransferase RsmA [Steroidobacteraceae bacterium]|nr:16S rRNA (adenine(1518)-N(6)/adenine(1519)-N(6))-dimethyltransferase RsmA [Steroidobacteraceae bacterium]